MNGQQNCSSLENFQHVKYILRKLYSEKPVRKIVSFGIQFATAGGNVCKAISINRYTLVTRSRTYIYSHGSVCVCVFIRRGSGNSPIDRRLKRKLQMREKGLGCCTTRIDRKHPVTTPYSDLAFVASRRRKR